MQPNTPVGIEQAARSYGVAPGGKAMMQAESRGAQRAIASGVYIVWRSCKTGADCARVGDTARCICGHSLAAHAAINRKNPQAPACTSCGCRRFEFVPSRPEECGMWWLPRRKGFNVHSWRAPCRCGHGHDAHDPITRRCRTCGCNGFTSNYACIGCEGSQEEHETVFELAEERAAAGRPVGAAFAPLHGMSTELRCEAGIGDALPSSSSSSAPSLEDQVAAGAMTAAQYHELLKAENASGSLGGAHAPPPPRVRRPNAPPSMRAIPVDFGDGRAATILTNMGPPDPGDGRRDWTREWEPASRSAAPRGGRGRGTIK